MTTTWTTFRTGGDPDQLRHYHSAGEYRDARESIGPHRVIGGGSNLLVSDRGPAGTIVILETSGSGVRDIQDDLVTLDAAGNWTATVTEVGHHDLAGIESMVGIPGTVGGAVVQNIGAYGTEICDVIESVEVLELSSGNTSQLERKDCGFAYRDSRFKSKDMGKYVVTGVTLRLVPGGGHTPRYAELARELQRRYGDDRQVFTLDQTTETVLDLRRGKNMVWDQQDKGTWGAGSFFVNPIVTKLQFEAVQAGAKESVPAWPIEASSDVKLSAGWLVEHAGFAKGHRWNHVALADGHALGIVNYSGQATTGEVIDAANEVAKAVNSAFGIRLRAEPILMGFDLDLDLDFDAQVVP